MRRLLAFITALLIAASASVFAIGFGYHVIEARADMDFGYGIFPLSLNYQFNFPVPDFIGGSTTELAFRLDNGLDFRELRQNPDDGSFYAETGVDHTTSYMAIYDEFNLFFNQGFWNNHITVGVSVDGRFENAYEAITFMRDGNDEGLFWTENETRWTSRFDESPFIGAPELAGDRSVFQTYLSGLFQLDFMSDEVVRRSGVRFTSAFRITGPWAPLNDGTANFLISENTLDLSHTLFSLQRGSGKNWMSFVLDNSTTYRYIHGDKVPFFAQGGQVWGDVYAPNTSHVITNSTSLTWYGPQLSLDTYPSVSVFYNIGWSLGKALNSNSDETYSETVVVYGIEAEIMLLDIAKFYWNWGFVTDPAFNEMPRAISSIGFTFGV